MGNVSSNATQTVASGHDHGSALSIAAPQALPVSDAPGDAGDVFSALGLTAWDAPAPLRVLLPLLAAGVFVSGLRDLAAAYGPRAMRFPW